MKRKWMIVAAASAAGITGAAWHLWPEQASPEPAAGQPAPAQAPRAEAIPAALSLPRDWPPALPAGADEPERVPLPPLEAPVPAAQSLAQARENGDPRTPPIQRGTDAARPTAAELADAAAYQRFEARQNVRLLSAFTRAAAEETPRLREDIARARGAGIAPEEIEKAEEKLRRIEEMRNQLLSAHPELAR